jgi:hypothetical protein
LKDGKSPEEIIREIYVRTLTRQPTDQEIASLSEVVAAEEDKAKALLDIFWAVMNSREFVFNH